MTAPAVPDLTARILEAIDKTERIAQACSSAPWVADVTGMVHVDPAAIRENKLAFGGLGYVAGTDPSPLGDVYRAHIALNDPPTVQRRCAADRRTVERHKREVEPYAFFGLLSDGQEDRRDVTYCALCTLGVGCDHCVSWSGQSELDDGPALWPCPTLRDLAEVYGITVDGGA